MFLFKHASRTSSSPQQALENKIQVLLKKVVVRPVHMEVLFLSIVKLIQSIARIVAASVLPCPRRELWMFDLIVSRLLWIQLWEGHVVTAIWISWIHSSSPATAVSERCMSNKHSELGDVLFAHVQPRSSEKALELDGLEVPKS